MIKEFLWCFSAPSLTMCDVQFKVLSLQAATYPSLISQSADCLKNELFYRYLFFSSSYMNHYLPFVFTVYAETVIGSWALEVTGNDHIEFQMYPLMGELFHFRLKQNDSSGYTCKNAFHLHCCCHLSLLNYDGWLLATEINFPLYVYLLTKNPVYSVFENRKLLSQNAFNICWWSYFFTIIYYFVYYLATVK